MASDARALKASLERDLEQFEDEYLRYRRMPAAKAEDPNRLELVEKLNATRTVFNATLDMCKMLQRALDQLDPTIASLL
ncbi:hypothetical protein [Singulisphaera sp. PoT]|uniref:hypothetical protein n=1 Tax=Singulisphaera sp. PoT TaxID=3411797 RepID=UPI003BF567DA